MGEPRIAAFARLANGTAGPQRIIYGTRSKLVRYSHGVTYDPVHDELFATEPQTSAILVFKGGADGEAAPIRVIQGGKTQLHTPWQLALDLKHNEIFAVDFVTGGKGGVLAFARDANGNVPPLRVISGPKTGLIRPAGVAVDSDRNLLVVTTMTRLSQRVREHGGLFIFNRTDNGDVAPRGIIGGPRTGIYSAWQVATYKGLIFANISNVVWKPTYDLGGYACEPGVTRPSPWVWQHPPGFVGVWRETDHGDVPPEGIIGGGDSSLYGPVGLVIDPRDGEVIVTDQDNQIYSFLVPQVFAMGHGGNAGK
ncbi:MAG: hypothetical protein IVW54_19620 [Candidatus Binataceae bacterium]|nr:hypothetical protein [Candidatus Binataceae bacterium]